MLRNMENRGDPWGLGAAKRLEWTSDIGFEIPVVDGPIDDGVEYLFWVGCAGALDERACGTTRAVARLLHRASVSFAVLGPAETCTGDPVRRLGNEYLFQCRPTGTSKPSLQRGCTRWSPRVLICSIRSRRSTRPSADTSR